MVLDTILHLQRLYFRVGLATRQLLCMRSVLISAGHILSSTRKQLRLMICCLLLLMLLMLPTCGCYFLRFVCMVAFVATAAFVAARAFSIPILCSACFALTFVAVSIAASVEALDNARQNMEL